MDFSHCYAFAAVFLDTDFCAVQNDCHVNATCINLQTTHTCSCYAGFTGDGKTCVDVDECLTEGGLNGHHCLRNSKCRNTIGSYKCECDDGFVDYDGYQCRARDACAEASAVCGENARCVNLQTSYKCECLAGFDGDGIDCHREFKRCLFHKILCFYGNILRFETF